LEQIMRLFVLALAVPAFVQPALAHEHVRHHRHAVHAHDQTVRVFTRPELLRDRDAPIAVVVDERRRPFARRAAGHGELDTMIARHAQMNGVPEALVHRVVIRESRYNARSVGSGGAMGLMQIKYSTARAMGYTGSPSGLLDPETNLTYAVRYLAGAYRVAGGNSDRAVSNYAHGFYYAAKRQGVSPYAMASDRGSRNYASAQTYEQVADAGTPVLVRYSHRRTRHRH
jgi:soluble lytic murein transglycosylase-like protein